MEVVNQQSDIVFLSETWYSKSVSSKILQKFYEIHEHFGIRSQSKGRLSGGYLLCISKKLSSSSFVIIKTLYYCILRINFLFS